MRIRDQFACEYALGKKYGEERLEQAALRGLKLEAFSYKSIESILKNGLEKLPLPSPNTKDEPSLPDLEHANIRGSSYYQSLT